VRHEVTELRLPLLIMLTPSGAVEFVYCGFQASSPKQLTTRKSFGLSRGG
jgi:hypothetical protein